MPKWRSYQLLIFWSTLWFLTKVIFDKVINSHSLQIWQLKFEVDCLSEIIIYYNVVVGGDLWLINKCSPDDEKRLCLRVRTLQLRLYLHCFVLRLFVLFSFFFVVFCFLFLFFVVTLTFVLKVFLQSSFVFDLRLCFDCNVIPSIKFYVSLLLCFNVILKRSYWYYDLD